MKSFAFVFVCFQACLLQSAYTQCVGAGWNGYGYGIADPYPAAYGYGPGFAGPVAPCGIAEAYGGAGVGEVVVAGELPVAGATLVAGQVPILGAVEFGGVLPAAGAVTITGSCACGCGGYGPGPYYY